MRVNAGRVSFLLALIALRGAVAQQPGDSVRSQARDRELAGVVVAQGTKQPIANAQLSIAKAAGSATTSDSGRFQFDELPPGVHRIEVRRIGFQPLSIDVNLESRRTELTLEMRRIVTLDSVTVRAIGGLADFEDHRRLGLGSFLTRSDLEKQEMRRLVEVIGTMRGVRLVGNSVTSNRGPRSLTRGCRPHIYLDSHLVGDINLNTIPVASVEAIEFYAGPAQTPMRYSKLNSDCGVLVIWTRR